MVRVKYNEDNKATLQIMLDKDNHGIKIAECEIISTALSTILDVNDPISNEYHLEISSPGINRPLTRRKDFNFWNGCEIKVKITETVDQRKNFKGILKGTKGNEILLEIKEGTIGLSFDWIEEAHLSISMNELLRNSKSA